MADDNEIYADFIRGLVARQDERKQSLEARGITVITTSGVLATLLFGFAALADGSDDLTISGCARKLLGVSLLFFGLAAALALVTNVPLRYGEPRGATGHELLDAWSDDVPRSRREVAKAWAQVFEQAKDRNDQKAWILAGATTAEGLGVVFVALAVWLSL